jgi:hypothetical protein
MSFERPSKDREILALSVRQPWAHYIAHHRKDIENRSRHTNYRGYFLIHASSTITKAEEEAFLKLNKEIKVNINDLNFGGIVGWGYIAESCTFSSSRWFSGPRGWCIDKAGELDYMPCKGRLGFFPVSDEIYEAIIPKIGRYRK